MRDLDTPSPLAGRKRSGMVVASRSLVEEDDDEDQQCG